MVAYFLSRFSSVSRLEKFAKINTPAQELALEQNCTSSVFSKATHPLDCQAVSHLSAI
jgi:hypothetical protein